MENIINHVKNCIGELLNYSLFLMAEIFIFSGFTGGLPGLPSLVLPMCIPFFYYLVRCKVHRFWLFALLHLLPLYLLWSGYRDNLSQLIIFSLAAVIQMMLSLQIRIAAAARHNDMEFGVFAVRPAVVVVLGVGLYSFSNLYQLIQIVIFFFALYFIYLYLDNFLHYAEMSKRTTGNVPVKSIFSVNFALIGAFAAICTLFALSLSERNFIRTLLDWILKLIGRIITVVLTFLMNILQLEEEQATAEQLTTAEEEMEVFVGEGGLLVKILNALFYVVGTAILLAVAVMIIYGIVMLIRWAFARKPDDTPTDGEEANKDIVEKLTRKEGIREEGFGGLFKTPEEKIRKIFWTTLRKQYRKNRDPAGMKILRNGTARECIVLFEEEKEEAVSLIRIYEKARYAGESCTEKDVKEARRLAGLLSNN